ncbi:MAG: hypothetical protein AAFO86_03030 [Pseudomonadota bacterium]
MKKPFIKPGHTPGGSARNHAGRKYSPKSCTGYADKMSNLERTIGAVDADFEDELAALAFQETVNDAMLVTSVLKDSCVAFLDLGAAILHTVGMKQAAMAAEKGLDAISAAEDGLKVIDGKMKASDALKKVADIGTDRLTKGHKQGKALGHAIKRKTDGMKVVADAATARTGKDKRQIAADYVRNQINSTADIIIDAVSSKDDKALKRLGGVIQGVKGLVALHKYNLSLEGSFDHHIDEQDVINARKRDAQDRYRRKMKQLKAEMEQLKTKMKGCIESSQQGDGASDSSQDLGMTLA